MVNDNILPWATVQHNNYRVALYFLNAPTGNSAMKILDSPFSLSYQFKMLKSVATLPRTGTLFDFYLPCVSAMPVCACRKHFVCNQNTEGITAYFSLLCFTNGEGITPYFSKK